MDIASAFQELGIDTKQFGSGSHYVQCPSDECRNRKKKNNKSLLIRFEDGYYECFHCHWKGFVNSSNGSQAPQKLAPMPKKAQKFLDEPEFNWIFPDTTIDPKPADPTRLSGKYTITFYYRNAKGRITSAKRMLYNFQGREMRRDKESIPLFTTTRDDGYYPCLFYEHHLTQFPNATVILVESEKTACMLSHKFKNHLNEFIFIATSGTNGLTDEKLPPLKNRNIWICYDCDNGEIQPDGSVKNPRGREGAQAAHEKLEKISNSRVVDIDPSKTDGTDLADMLRDIDIDFIRNLPERVPQNIRDMWAEVLMEEEPPAEVPIIQRDGVILATLGNNSLVTGKKKSRKTLFLIMLVLWFLENNSENSVLLFDTEQGKSHVWKVRQKIFQLTGKWVPVFFLRGQSYTERQNIIQKTVQYWPTKLKWIVVDGIRDLLSNINDPDQCTDLVTWVEKINVRYNIHITNVLHLNKTDNNARGHIGTELSNKAEMNYELEKDEKSDVTIVKCESSRDKPFETFAFTHSADNLPELVNVPIKGSVLPDRERKKRLTEVFEENIITYAQFMEGVREQFDCGEKKAKSLIAEFKRIGWVVKGGETGTKGANYKLMITDNGQEISPAPPVAQKQYQPDLFLEARKLREKPEPVSEPEQEATEGDSADLPF